MGNRIGSFISSIITIVLSLIGVYFCYQISVSNSNLTGVDTLGLVVTVPILLVAFLVVFGLSLSSVLTSFRACFSENKAIKIISIILLVISIAIIVITILLLIQSLKF